MLDTHIDYSRLGWNIKCLRESFGETLDDLKNAIGANSTGTISFYESGKKIPNRNTLLKIAKHYRVTVNDLLNNDFSCLNSLNLFELYRNESAMTALIMGTVFPAVVSSDAMKCKSFELAYKLHYYLMLQLKDGKSFDSKLSQLCVSLYQDAELEEIPEATANLLWWKFIEGITILGLTPKVLQSIKDGQPTQIDVDDYIKNQYLWKVEDSDDDIYHKIEEAKAEYNKEMEPEYTRLLKKLKHSSGYSELADYYSAIRYLIGLVDNHLTREMNAVVGSEMIAALDKMENKYVSSFLDTMVDMV